MFGKCKIRFSISNGIRENRTQNYAEDDGDDALLK